LLARHTLLFIGFSLEDPYFRFQIEWISKVFPAIVHYAIVHERNVEKLRKMNIPVQPVIFQEYGEPLLATVRDLGEIAARRDSDARSARAFDSLLREGDCAGLEAVLELMSLLVREGRGFDAMLDQLKELRPSEDSSVLFRASSEIAGEIERDANAQKADLGEREQAESSHLRRLEEKTDRVSSHLAGRG
jgi:hypothetical protein